MVIFQYWIHWIDGGDRHWTDGDKIAPGFVSWYGSPFSRFC